MSLDPTENEGNSRLVNLNVGGVMYHTSAPTLLSVQDSFCKKRTHAITICQASTTRTVYHLPPSIRIVSGLLSGHFAEEPKKIFIGNSPRHHNNNDAWPFAYQQSERAAKDSHPPQHTGNTLCTIGLTLTSAKPLK